MSWNGRWHNQESVQFQYHKLTVFRFGTKDNNFDTTKGAWPRRLIEGGVAGELKKSWCTPLIMIKSSSCKAEMAIVGKHLLQN